MTVIKRCYSGTQINSVEETQVFCQKLMKRLHMFKKTQKRLASQSLVGEVRTLQRLNNSTVLKSSHIKPFRSMKQIVSNIVSMCDSLTPGKIRRKVFVVMRRVNANPRWRTKGCGLAVEMRRRVGKGTDSSFPHFMLSIKNVLAVRS